MDPSNRPSARSGGSRRPPPRGEDASRLRAELEQIPGYPMARDHGILIDVARCFTGEGGYPTLDFLRNLAAKAGFGHFEVEDDILRIHRRF